MEDLLRVGVISSAHGIKGEVNVFPTTDEPEMFALSNDYRKRYEYRSESSGKQLHHQ